ncbi:hypothetical protein ACVWW4_003873 [Bradyrhizobium sp. LB7.1]
MCKIHGESGCEAGVALPPASKESRMTYHGSPIAWTWIIIRDEHPGFSYGVEAR